MINPFSGRGAPVSGERLVGRKTVIERLTERIDSGAHCSIVGLPRLGKTSIAKEILRRCNSVQNSVSVGYLTLDAISGPTQAYMRMLEETALDSPESNISNLHQSHDDSYQLFLRVLRKRKKDGFRSVVVIDEMDSIARGNFSDPHLFISRLREIANDSDRYGITFVFVSRRSLDMIQGSVDCSTLAGLCEVVYIKPLNFNGLCSLAMRSPISVNKSALDSLWLLTGGHPFLAEVIMCEAVDQEVTQLDEVSIADAQHIQAHEFTNQYRNLQNLFSQDGIFDSLCELAVGPRWRPIEIRVISLLKNYGLIHSTKDLESEQECMSQHFKDFLAQISRMMPTWFLLGDVEKQLRILVDSKMLEVYGLDWSNKIKEKYPQLKNIDGLHLIERLCEQIIRERRQFGDAASDFLLDYGYIGDLKDLIFVEWDRYRMIFGGTKNDWDKRFQDIIKIRNPMAHNRPVPSDIIQEAEKSCKVILERISRS